MEKIKNKNRIVQWKSFDKVVTELSKSKAFRKAYTGEITRRKLAKQIRDLRAEKGLTQKKVAVRAGMPQSVIARIESGDRGVSVDTLGRLAHAFGKEVQLV